MHDSAMHEGAMPGRAPPGARLLHAAAWLIGSLPPRAMAALAGLAAHLAGRRGRDWQVARTNLALVATAAGIAPGRRQVHAAVRNARLTALESLRFWTRPAARNLRRVRAVEGAGHLDQALASGRGAILAAPHYGNWELLNQWLAARTPLAVLYAPPGSGAVEAFLTRARARPGVLPVRADAAAVRRLLRRLQDGGVLGILPDQQPKRGEGVHAPFFGQPALTMTLLSRLAARSGATVLLAAAERDPDERGFTIRIEPVDAAVADRDPARAAAALNAAIERLVLRAPLQYQWTYKRFSIQPDGSNPYWPQCYPRHAGRH
jgi:Kdo2-lipid IVA lauroyltransferase/acyltransferase